MCIFKIELLNDKSRTKRCDWYEVSSDVVIDFIVLVDHYPFPF